MTLAAAAAVVLNQKMCVNTRNTLLNTNILASVENYCIFDEPRNKLVGGKR